MLPVCLHSVTGQPNVPRHVVGTRDNCGGCADFLHKAAIPPETERDREVLRAMLLAKDLATCEALLRGESVPDESIDWEQAARFGVVRR